MLVGGGTFVENEETQSVAMSSALYIDPLVNGGNWTENEETQSVAMTAAAYLP